MRMFFSLQPSPSLALEIHAWQQLNWPTLQPAVPAENYHITVLYLGEVAEHQLALLQEAIEQLRIKGSVDQPLELHLDQIGFWPKSEVLWLGSTTADSVLEQLAKNLGRVTERMGWRRQHRTFHPHLTLKRRPKMLPAAPLVEPDFTFVADMLWLCESVQRNTIQLENGIYRRT